MEPLLISKREKRKLASQYADLCLTCGTCAGGCPVTGVDGLDVRKVVRLALLGMDQEVIDSRFPWVCTLCGRCEHACPMNIDLAGAAAVRPGHEGQGPGARRASQGRHAVPEDRQQRGHSQGGFHRS